MPPAWPAVCPPPSPPPCSSPCPVDDAAVAAEVLEVPDCELRPDVDWLLRCLLMTPPVDVRVVRVGREAHRVSSRLSSRPSCLTHDASSRRVSTVSCGLRPRCLMSFVALRTRYAATARNATPTISAAS